MPPQAIAVAVAAVVGEVAVLVFGSGIISIAITEATYTAVLFAAKLSISMGLAAIVNDTPKPEFGKTNIKSTIAPRTRGYGRARLGGSHMLFEAKDNEAYVVLALHDGKITSFEQWYFNDDEITLSGHTVQRGDSGAYANELITLYWRSGLATETAYTGIPSSFWGSTYRGDGIASAYMNCVRGRPEFFAKRYPNGLPVVTVVATLSPVFDWRDVSQSISDPTTWELSYNPIVCLADYLCNPDSGGPELDFDTVITPLLSLWTAAADVCDESVTLKAGGTVAKYTVGGTYAKNTTPSTVVAQLLQCCDGWLATDGDGALAVYAGKYYIPTVTFDDPMIVGYTLQRYVEDEVAVNNIILSFVDPAHEYSETQTDPWIDQDDIDARGEQRDRPLSLQWTQNNSTARRLAKRLMSRLEGARGTLTTNLAGLEGLGERFIRVQISEVAYLSDIVIEVQNVEIDLASMTVTFDWIEADPNIDAWNPATEEGDGPQTEGRPAKTELAAPTITGVEFFDEGATTADSGVRLLIDVTDPGVGAATWYARWRPDGGISWVEQAYNDVEPGFGVQLQTGFVPVGGLIDVEVAYQTAASFLSPWSDPFSVDTAAAVAVAPDPPTGVSAAASYEVFTNGTRNAKITVTMDETFDSAISFRARWKRSTDDGYQYQTFEAAVSGGASSGIQTVLIETVPTDATVNVAIQTLLTAHPNLQSAWVSASDVNTTPPTDIPVPTTADWGVAGVTVVSDGATTSFASIELSGAVNSTDLALIDYIFVRIRRYVDPSSGYPDEAWSGDKLLPKNQTKFDFPSVLPETLYDVEISYIAFGITGDALIFDAVLSGVMVIPGGEPDVGATLLSGNGIGAYNYTSTFTGTVDITLTGASGAVGDEYIPEKGDPTYPTPVPPGVPGSGSYCFKNVAVTPGTVLSGNCGVVGVAGYSTCVDGGSLNMDAEGGGASSADKDGSIDGVGGVATGGSVNTNGSDGAGDGTTNGTVLIVRAS